MSHKLAFLCMQVIALIEGVIIKCSEFAVEEPFDVYAQVCVTLPRLIDSLVSAANDCFCSVAQR